MVRVYYSPAYAGAGYAFDTTRKARWIAESLVARPIPGVGLVEPKPLAREQVAAAHDAAYIDAVATGSPRELAESQGFAWDSGLYPMVLASNGGAVAAARDALNHGVAGTLSSGLHHARRNRGAGFCTFNGLAIAAREALAAGARNVLILDFDAHCGGGTASLIEDDARIWQFDVSVDLFDFYRNGERIHLQMVRQASQYLPAIRGALNQAERCGQTFDLCLYNAGMDPYEGCPTGGLAGVTQQMLAEREQMVFAWCARHELPIAFVLAGGYVGPRLDQQGLVELHRLTLAAAAATPGHAACARPATTP